MSLVKNVFNYAEENPNKIAIVEDGISYTYRELIVYVKKIASSLQKRGVKRNNRVVIYRKRDFLCVASILAVNAIGAVYIPISQKWTLEWMNYVIRECDVKLVINEKENMENVNCLQICVENLVTSLTDFKLTCGDLAYILHTSGSTGYPKGVCISSRAAKHFVDWSIETFKIHDSDIVASVNSFAFDMSVLDIFSSLSAGATVDIVPDKIIRFPAAFTEYIEKDKITILYTVPSYICNLISYGLISRRKWSLRLFMFAGEVFDYSKFCKLQNMLPQGITYANLYGPTETNVCLYYVVSMDEINKYGEIPIGIPINGDSVVIDEKNGNELIVFGPNVMDGYVNNNYSDIWYEINGKKGYRTGDAVEQKDGMYFYRGRKDALKKINGYRVDLNGIYSKLLCLEEISNVYANTIKADGVERLILFVLTNSEVEVSNQIKKVRRCLKELPQYMNPWRIIIRKEFPYTDSGKIDGRRLLKEYEEG